MKAIVCTRYGPTESLQFSEAAKPVPTGNEVLIKIRAASVNPVDRIFRVPYILRVLTGLRKPKDARVGRDVAGQVDSQARNCLPKKLNRGSLANSRLIGVNPQWSAVDVFPISAMTRDLGDSGDYLRFPFFFHRDFDLADHIAMQADRHFKLAQALDRLIELQFAPVNVEAFVLQRFRNVRRGDRSK
jgi:hypothetical protein